MTNDQKPKEKSRNFECAVRDAALILSLLVWVGSILANLIGKYAIPNSIEVIATMSFGYLLGDRVIDKIKNRDK